MTARAGLLWLAAAAMDAHLLLLRGCCCLRCRRGPIWALAGSVVCLGACCWPRQRACLCRELLCKMG